MRRFAAAFLILLLVFPGVSWPAQQSQVAGRIIAAASNLPVPGLTVVLVHPALGRSAAATTDERGMFQFYGIPLRGDPYYLEVYWGSDLVSRTPATIATPFVDLGTIFI